MNRFDADFTQDRQLGRRFAAGEVIFQKGDLADSLYVIQKGQVELVMVTPDGEDVLAILSPGQLFGEISLFTADKHRFITARAKEEVHLLTVDERTFIKRLHQDPSLAFRLLRHMAQRIKDLDLEREKWIRWKKVCGLSSEAVFAKEEEGAEALLRRVLNVFDFSAGYHVLMVEDDTDFVRLVEIWLQSTAPAEVDNPLQPPKFSITHVTTLAEARELLCSDKFDLVLLDLNLPDSQGMETLSNVTPYVCETPIVVFSGDRREESLYQAIHKGAQDFLVKGEVKKEQFQRAIRFALERHRFRHGDLLPREVPCERKVEPCGCQEPSVVAGRWGKWMRRWWPGGERNKG